MGDKMKELWKSIKEFDGLYEVSNMGQVRNSQKGNLLKPHRNTVGYLQVCLTKDNRSYFRCIHKLVAEAFVDNARHCNEVNHIDENKENNRADNLEWCTHRENIMHGTCVDRAVKTRQANRPPKKVLAIFPDNSTHCYRSVKDASKELGINEKCIRTVLSGNRHKHLGTRWLYLE